MKRTLAYLLFSCVLSMSGFSQITITSPIGGSTINDAQDNTLFVSGTAAGITDQTTVTVTITDGTNTVQTTIPLAGSWTTGSLNLLLGSPGALAEGTNNLTIDAVTNGTILDATDVVVSYDRTAPTGYSVTFNDDPVLVATEAATGFTFAGATPGTTYNYTITSTGGGTPLTNNGVISTATDNIPIDVSSLNNGTLNLSVTLTDPAGNEGAAALATATYDGSNPEFVTASYYDTNGDGNIDEVLVELDESISDASVTLANFSFGGGAPASVATTVNNPDDPDSPNDEFVTFEVSLSGTEAEASSYTAGTLLGVDGNPVLTDGSITSVDNADPVLTSQSPSDDDTGVAVNSNITLTFSENVQVGTGNISIIDISGPDDRVITLPNGQISFATNTVTINPSSDLAFFTEYAINVGSSAISDGINTFDGIAGTTAFSFTTEGEVPTYDATWLDNNGDGTIDRLRLSFSIPVIVADADGGVGGFDAILLGGGLAIAASNYSGTVSELDLIVTGVSSGTADPSVSIQYTTGGASSIVASDGGEEVPNTETPGSIFDGADPVVLNVTSLDADGTYILGDPVSIDVEFSENVTAMGTPQLTLETGGTDAVVDLSSGSGSSTLTFDYIVALGESSADLNYQSTGALSEGTSIRDGANNNADRTLPTLGGAGSLATNKNFVIDGVVPVVTNVTSPDANITYIPGQSITIQVTFDDIVNVTGIPTITLETGTTDAVINLTTGSGTNTLSGTYNISLGEETSDLDYVAGSLTAGTSIQDANGNNADLALATPGAAGSLGNNKNIGIDGVLPTFQNAHFFDTNGDGDIDEVVIEMSEPVDPLTAESFDFDLTGGAITGVELAGPASNTLDVSDVDEYVTLTTSLAGTGTANIDYDKAGSGGSLQLQDLAGNEADNDAAITEVDVAAPIVLSAITDDIDNNGFIDRIDVTMSENINDGGSTLNSSTFSIGGGYSGVTTGTGSSGSDNLLRISFTENSSPDTDATPSVTLTFGTVFDGATPPNSIGGNQAFGSAQDGADPVIVAAITIDDDLNGQIDGLNVELSEPINDVASDLDGGTVDLESPYNNNSPDAETGAAANDEFILVIFNEENTPDTDATPNITLNSGQLRDQSTASNVLGSNETFNGTADGAIPVFLLGSNPNPDVDESGVIVNDAREIDFTFSENIDAIGGNSIYIYNTDDLINPVVLADVTDGAISISGATVTWSHNELLDRGDSYVVGIDAGAFEDESTASLPSIELFTTGDNKWQWSMEGDGNPGFVYSPQDGTSAAPTSVPPFARIFFYFDKPVRIMNSVDKDLDADIIDDWAGSKDSDEFTVDIDNDDGQPGVGNGTIPISIYPRHTEPDNPANYTKEKIFDISDLSYNSGNGYKTSGSPIYRFTMPTGAFEDFGDGDSESFTIEFQIDGTDAIRPFVSSYVPAPATLNVDIETTTSLVINFNEPVEAGFGDIQLFANLDPDVLAFEIPASSPLVSVVGSQVTIDISGVTLAGNVEYYVNFDKGAFVDIAGNTNVGISDETTWNFTMEAEFNAPEITSLTPADNATGVSVDQDLTIIFDEPVQEGAGGNLNVRLSSNGFVVETIPSSSFTFDGNEVTIPLAQLGGLSGYYINLDNTAIEDLGGNAFPGITGSFAWSFTTASEAVSPSAITSTFTPADLSSGASVSDNISFFFDEVVSPRAGNLIEIRESGGALIESFDVTDPEILVSGNQVVINPTDDLSFVTGYYVTVAAGAFEDASGNLSNAVGGDGNWNFTTGADASNPFVLTLSPSDDATGISLSPIITIGFSESVQDQGAGIVNLLYTDGTVAHTLDLSDFNFGDDLNPSINLATIPGPITLSGNTEYFVEIPATAFEDLSGLPFAGIAGNGNWSFTTTTDITQPIPSGSPTGAGVAVTTDLVITFPEPVTANTGAIRLLYTDLTEVEVFDVSAAEAGNGNTTYTIETSNNLSGGVQYYVNIDAGAFVDNTGNPSTGVIGSIDWSFTTSDDGVAPEIVSLTPANDATSISTASASLVLTFDEPVNLGSGNIQLSYDDGVVIETFTTGNVSLSNGNTVATVAPYGVLDGQTEFYVAVDNGFFEDNDSSPNDFAGFNADGSWSFFTGDDSIDPSASGGVTPAPGTTGNPVDPTMTITMNERVNAGTGVITISAVGQTVSINVLDGTQITGFGTNTITINPSESLINGEDYTVTVPAGAFEDPTGNTNSLIAWSFEVGNATIVTASNNLICTNDDFISLDDLVISETNNSDFLVGSNLTVVISLPAQFEFNTALTPNVNISGGDLSAGSAVIDVNTMTITYSTDGQSGGVDEITISNLEARYVGTATGVFNALRTGGTGIMKGNNVVHGQPHFIFNVNDPTGTPTLSGTALQADGSEDLIDDPALISNGISATGAGTITWYNDDYSASITGSATTTASLPDPSSGFDISNADNGLYTYFITANDGTCESDPFKRNILIAGYAQTPGGNDFVDDAEDLFMRISKPSNHTVEFTGPGLFEPEITADSAKIKFSPSIVGVGDHDVLITTTNTITGESLAYTETFSIFATAQILDVPIDIDYCQNGGILTINPRLDDIPTPTWAFYGMYLDGVLIDPPPGWNPNSANNPTMGWELDLSTVTPGKHKLQRYITVALDPIVFPPANFARPFLQADLDVYPVPTVELNNLPQYICEDAFPISLNVDITNQDFVGIETTNTLDVTSYQIQKTGGVGAGATVFTFNDDILDPSNPLRNGTIAEGTYEITYTSPAAEDPNSPTPNDSKGCSFALARTVFIEAVPDLPLIETVLTGIGSENADGDRINLQFCVGEAVPDLTARADPDEQITWYTNNSLTTSYNSIGSRGQTLEAEELFGTATPNNAFDINIYVTKTDYIDAGGSGFAGCESPPLVINLRVYEDPAPPEIDVTQAAASQLSTSRYLFEYCDTFGSDRIQFSSVLPDREAYYRLFDANMNFEENLPETNAGWPLDFFEFSDIGFSGLPGSDTTIFISRVLNDSTWVTPGAEFAGCESELIELEIRVYEQSPAPDTTLLATGRPDYYICSGEDLATITSPGEQDTRYSWYPDNSGVPDFSAEISVAAFDGRFIVQNELEVAGFSNTNNTTDAIVYTYWITQFQDFNDETGFIGCESDPSRITITVFPDPGPPEFSAPMSSNIFRDPVEFQLLAASYCQDQITGGEDFLLNGNTDAIFNWYRSTIDGDTIIGNAVHTHIASEPVTRAQLKITDSEQDTIYFVVTQTNNITPAGAAFDGCETELDEMAFVQLYVYDIPEQPTTSDGSYTYCEDAVLVNGISLDGEDGVTFYWYRDGDDDGNIDSEPFHNGSFASANDLDLLNLFGTGSYNFWVTQTQDSTSGVATFAGCESDPRLITVFEVPPELSESEIDFSTGYIASSNGYCVDQLTGTVNISYTGVSNATFSIYDAAQNPIRVNSPELFFNTGQDAVGTYTYFISQTLNNCESPLHEVTFNIFDTPATPEFNLASNVSIISGTPDYYEIIYCRDEDIADEVLMITNSQPGNTYEWYFDIDLDESITQGIVSSDTDIDFVNLDIPGVDNDLQVKNAGTFSRFVRSQESNECFSPVRRFDLVVGEAPEVAFTWQGLMDADSIEFTLINDNPAVSDVDVQELEVTIDGSITFASGTYTNNDTYRYLFDAGEHEVEVFMRTSEVCRDSVKRTVTVVPLKTVDINGLLEDFEDTDHGWFAEYRTLDGKLDTLVNSWELGNPSTATLSNAFSGSNAWVTNLDGEYNPAEISWVYSAAYDISQLSIPIVSFYHQHWFFNTRDAVVLQYSTDNGVTWSQLGELTNLGSGIVEASGRNWYTDDEIATQPGVFNVNSVNPNTEFNESTGGGLFGWAGSQSNELPGERTSDWLLTINKMVTADIVIFRFALAASAGDQDEGFAFDDFRVYNSDKITLLESFYNASEPEVKAAYDDLEGQVNAQSLGSIAWINYFTDLDMSSGSGRDEINRSNTIDPSARVGYYGINEAPKSAIEGEVQSIVAPGQDILELRGFTPSALGVAGLESKKFDITNFQLDPTAPNDILRVSATFIANQDFDDPNSEFSIRFVVVEKEVTGVTAGEFVPADAIRNVMRKILPNAAGIIKQGAMTQGTSFTETVEWKISNVYDPTQLDVIAFIQNENAVNGRREVFQSAILNGDFGDKQLILSVFDQLRNGDPFVIYPNPVDDEFKLEILNPVKEAMDWTIFDQTGREVMKGQVPGGEMSVDISTNRLPSGMFLLQLIHNDILFEPKRIIVVHE